MRHRIPDDKKKELIRNDMEKRGKDVIKKF